MYVGFYEQHKRVLNIIGLSHTLLCGGIVFGWSSLEHVFRQEQIFNDSRRGNLQYSAIFTAGTTGVYLSNLLFGSLLDIKGAKLAGTLASVCFGFGLLFCSFALQSGVSLGIGIFLLGISGPAVQLTTIPFSSLYDGYVAVVIRSLHAATFDGSSVMFYIAKLLHVNCGVSSRLFFLCALTIPLYTVSCQILMWPVKRLDQYRDTKAAANLEYNDDITSHDQVELICAPRDHKLPTECKDSGSSNDNCYSVGENYHDSVRTLALRPDFLYLVVFTSVHVLKLNFIIVSLNTQLDQQYSDSEKKRLLFYFGLILPLGFLFMPISTWLLHKNRRMAFQVANMFGLLYGTAFIIKCLPLQILLTYPLVSVSRQLIFSTVFQEVASRFGFQYFGSLMGIVNATAALLGCLQFALVALSEGAGSYYISNMILILLGLPLFLRDLCKETYC